MKVIIKYINGNIREINLEDKISKDIIRNAQYSCEEFAGNKNICNETISTNVIIKNISEFVADKEKNIEYEIYVAIRNHDIKKDGTNEIFTNPDMDTELGETAPGKGLELNHKTPYAIKLPIATGIILSQFERDKIKELKIKNTVYLYYDHIFEKLLCLKNLLYIESELPDLYKNSKDATIWERFASAKNQYEKYLNYSGKVATDKQIADILGLDANLLNNICKIVLEFNNNKNTNQQNDATKDNSEKNNKTTNNMSSDYSKNINIICDKDLI